MQLTENKKMKKLQNLSVFALVLTIMFSFTACSNEKLSAPPVIKVFVNDDDVTAAPTVYVISGTRIEYRFEIAASTTITNVKTVIFDVSIPTKKISKEVLVGGQTNSTSEVVKGVLFATSDTEIMQVVKDIDGNEVSKSFTIIVQ